MKTSLIIPVLNEEKSIGQLLDSLRIQTRKPDEIILIDGGSTDNTLSVISGRKVQLRVFGKPGLSIAVARNYGVMQATGEIIAMTDAGCIAHKDWFEKIIEPFSKKNVDIVAGFYRMVGSKPIQKAFAAYLGISPEKYDPNKFLPSARSMAFRKSLWKKIGGFDEKLEKTAEDTKFNHEAIAHGARIVRAKDALVDWELPQSLREGLSKFYTYAKGDGQARIWLHPHTIKIISIFLRYIAGFIILFLFRDSNLFIYAMITLIVVYLFFPIWKMRYIESSTSARLWLPLIQVLSDFAVMLGFLRGVIKR